MHCFALSFGPARWPADPAARAPRWSRRAARLLLPWLLAPPVAAQTTGFDFQFVNASGILSPNQALVFQLRVTNRAAQPQAVRRAFLADVVTDSPACGRVWFGDAGYAQNYPHIENETTPPQPPHPLPSVPIGDVLLQPGETLTTSPLALYMIQAAGNDCQGINVTLVPEVELASYAVAARAEPAAGGSVSCTPSPVAYAGDSACTAEAAAGHVLTGFTGCDSVSGAVCQLGQVTSDRQVVARFNALPVTPVTPVPTLGGWAWLWLLWGVGVLGARRLRAAHG